jgi:hypothetical protein
VIWVIDNGATMAAVATTYSEAIAQVHLGLQHAGVDLKTVVISGTPKDADTCDILYSGICVKPPVGAETCPGETGDFKHVQGRVDGPIWSIDGSYPSWADFARAGASKAIIVVTNTAATRDPDEFLQSLRSLSPSLGVWRMHGVICGDTCEAPDMTCNVVGKPHTGPRCLGSMPYRDLITESGGTSLDFCTLAAGAAVPGLVEAVLAQASPPGCEFSLEG